MRKKEPRPVTVIDYNLSGTQIDLSTITINLADYPAILNYLLARAEKGGEPNA